MNPAKVLTDTKMNPETVYDDNPSSKWFPRDLLTGLQSDMNPTKAQTDIKRNPETVYDENPSSGLVWYTQFRGGSFLFGKNINQGLNKHQELFHPRDKSGKIYCDILRPFWCNIKVDPER